MYHSLYFINDKSERVWLGKTPSQDFYISNIPTKNGIIYLEVQSETFGGEKGKVIRKMINVSK